MNNANLFRAITIMSLVVGATLLVGSFLDKKEDEYVIPKCNKTEYYSDCKEDLPIEVWESNQRAQLEAKNYKGN